MVHQTIARFKKVAARKRQAAATRRAIRRTAFRFSRGADYLMYATDGI